ncbi:metal ABC transporter permease [Stomatobaculum sp.]
MIDVILVLLSTSLCLGVPGCFLVLRRLSMTADAVSHAVLLGIALGFFFVRDLNSPVLIVSAALFGLFSILLTEWIALRCHIARDEALGLVFPVFFALGVILVTRCFRNVHLDTELILMGNPLFAPFLRSFGLPRAVVWNLLLFAVNLAFAGLCFRPLAYACFDPSYASLLGLPLRRLSYGLLTLSTFSAVVAFQSVGAVLSIAFFVAAAAAASLLARSLKEFLALTLFIGAVVAVLSTVTALRLNVSLSGMCAVFFLLVLLLMRFSAFLRKHQQHADCEKEGAE